MMILLVCHFVKVAHELGHNLGMDHDTDTCECPELTCLMSPSAMRSQFMSSGPFWSSCSSFYLKKAFSQGMDHCLKNIPDRVKKLYSCFKKSQNLIQIFDGPVCGNGFTEPGEECDCIDSRDTCRCCDPTTCTLTHGATCGADSCCDRDTCGVRGKGEVCRHVQGECDLEEVCDGVRHTCPRDVYKVKTGVI